MTARLLPVSKLLSLLFSLLPVLLLLMSLRSCRADGVSYGASPTITGQSTRFTAIHHHDWSQKTYPEVSAIFFDLNHHEQIFSPEKNHFSYLKLFDRTTGKMVFRAPVPALSYLWVSPDDKYVVGLSGVMLRNPYQLVVFTTDGKLVYKEHISDQVAVFTPAQLETYYRKFPKAKKYLSPRSRTVNTTTGNESKIYIDAFILGMPNNIGDAAFMRLIDFQKPNPYSPNFSSSVTNSVYWFNEQYPNVNIREENGVTRLRINDPEGKPFDIVIRGQAA